MNVQSLPLPLLAEIGLKKKNKTLEPFHLSFSSAHPSAEAGVPSSLPLLLQDKSIPVSFLAAPWATNVLGSLILDPLFVPNLGESGECSTADLNKFERA